MGFDADYDFNEVIGCYDSLKVSSYFKMRSYFFVWIEDTTIFSTVIHKETNYNICCKKTVYGMHNLR